MDFKKLMQQVAKEEKTTPEEVEKEIRFAIKEAGYDMEPDEFIAYATMLVVSKMDNLPPN